MDQPPLDEITRRVRGYSEFMDAKTFAGIATFFRSNLRTEWTDVDVALVGAADRRRLDPAHGRISYYNPLTKVIPFELARVADIGDVPLVSAFNLEAVVAEIHAFYARLHRAQIVPVTAGGDHSITYPILKAIAAGEPVGLVHIDAHLDTSDRIADSTVHHGAPFKNAVLDGALDPKRTVHIAPKGSEGQQHEAARSPSRSCG